MRVCVVGGIFDKDASYREIVPTTPETTLAAGLAQRGHDVEVRGHWFGGTFDRFDVVHVHHLSRGAVAAAADPGSARFVYTNHGNGHPSSVMTLAWHLVVARADAVVALSPAEASWQRRQRRLTARQRVIPNGVDEDVFRFAPPQKHAGRPWRILYVGQLVALKGVGYLLQAVAEIQRELRLELDLVYHVDTELAKLRAQALDLGLTNVNFLGNKSPPELAQLYVAADVLVLPSTTEALPSVVSEAIMVGRPVVATDVGGVRDQVGGFGTVVKPRDAAALALGIRRVIADYDRYTAGAAQASETARARFSVTAMLDEHERLYEEVLRRQVRRHQAQFAIGNRIARRSLGARALRPRANPLVRA